MFLLRHRGTSFSYICIFLPSRSKTLFPTTTISTTHLHQTLRCNPGIQGEIDNKFGNTVTPSTTYGTLAASTTSPTSIPTGTHAHSEPETHPATIAHNAQVHRSRVTLLVAHDPNVTVPELSMRQLFAIPIIGALCLSGCALCFVATAFDAVFVLFCYTPIESGGLSFNVRVSCNLVDAIHESNFHTPHRQPR